MSCIYKIKDGMGSFTDTEKKLAEYILENKGEITLLSRKICKKAWLQRLS